VSKEIEAAVIIPIKGLTSGVYTHKYTCGQPFFNLFGNQEIREAIIEVTVVLTKENHLIRLEVTLQGSVIRSCDRCLGDVPTPVSYHAPIVVEFAENDGDYEGEEIISISPTATQINLTQYVYDSICVSFPLQSLHPTGACDPVMENKLAQLTINYSHHQIDN